MPYVMGVGSPISFQETESFSDMLCAMDVAKPMLFWNSYEKGMGVSTPMTSVKGCLLYKNHG